MGDGGSQSWLNAGLKSSSSGWTPPFLDINRLSHISLADYYQGNRRACAAKYDASFRAAGKRYGIDPATLAFIPMQASSCDVNAGGATPGLMQCDPTNCRNGRLQCQYTVQDTVDCGAHVLRAALDRSKGNAVHALGSYNERLVHGRRRHRSRCAAEPLNGWFQGYDVYGADRKLDGAYNCDQKCEAGGSLC
ncbi:glycoside hydrolase family 23 protein [Moelleriella libera RCEF 2490]|uniref:Glycoside hydrolase family 23 protein n=1 Tax=Moelleriella libera RCEF 2490 TaxID=1081109 RepID=A0A162IKM1_9HYPO|nr:glycoside hydrolase family 23 protein [Moelleriella libera RCEF 2490]